MTHYHITRNFTDRGMSVKIKPTNFLMCLYWCALGLERPRKLNRENFPSDQSAKIGPLEKFPAIWYYYYYRHELTSDLVNEVCNEEDKGEDTSDEGTYPDVRGLAAGAIGYSGRSGRPPVPVSSLYNAACTVQYRSLIMLLLLQHLLLYVHL